MPFLYENLFYRILKGNISSNQDAVFELEKFDIKLNASSFLVLSVKLDFLNMRERQGYSQSEFIEINNKVKSIIHAMLSQEYECYTVDIDIGNVAYILSGTDLLEANAAELCLKAEDFFKTGQYNLRITAGIGLKCTSIMAIRDSYNQSVKALNSRSVSGDSQVLIYNICMEAPETFYDMNNELKGITNCLLGGDYSSSLKLASGLLDKYISENHSYENVCKLMKVLTSTFISSVKSKGYTLEEFALDENTAYMQIDSLIYKEEFMQYLANICNQTYEQISRKAKVRSEETLNFILRYITTNYCNDIYLDAIAEELSMSPNYLSQFFKEYTGINFFDYLTSFRIEKAKELLRDTGMPVSDIGLKVGYINATSFIRTFKKLEKITPGKYRDIHQDVHGRSTQLLSDKQ